MFGCSGHMPAYLEDRLTTFQNDKTLSNKEKEGDSSSFQSPQGGGTVNIQQ